jgi:hypothetical protein
MNAIQTITKLKGVKLFVNTRADVEVKLSKEESVPAALSYFNSESGYDIRVSPLVKSPETGREYTKISLSLKGDNNIRSFYNGFLNPVNKKDSEYAFVGNIQVGDDQLKMMVKNKTDKGFYPVSFFKEKAPEAAQAAPEAAPAEAAPAANGANWADTDIPF